MKLKKWDSAEYMQTEEDIALYLQACIDEAEDDTPTNTSVNHALNSGNSLLHLLSSESFSRAPKSNSQQLDQTVLDNYGT